MAGVMMTQLIKSDRLLGFWQSLRVWLETRRGEPSRIFSEIDYYRLQGLLTRQHQEKYKLQSRLFARLRRLLGRAMLYPCKRVPNNLITMNSVIRLRSRRGTEFTIGLVYPRDADKVQCKVSVLSPLGLALIGKTEGQPLSRNMVIEKVLYQPERLGKFYL